MSSMRLSPHTHLEAGDQRTIVWGCLRKLTLEVDVMLVRDAEDVVALVRLHGLDKISLRVLEMDFDAAAG